MMGKLQKRKTRKLIKNSPLKENKRNNSNSISCDYCGIINIGRDNNKFVI